MVSIMTETKPTYTTPPRRRHDDPAANAAAIIEATRRETTYRALDDAGAAERGLLALVAEVERLRGLLALGTLDIDALAAVGHALRDLRRQVEALGVAL